MSEEMEDAQGQVAPEQIEVQEEMQQEVEQASVSTRQQDDQHNWQQVREVLNAQKRQIEELESRLQQKNVPQEEPDEFAGVDDEEYIKVGQVKKLADKLAEKKARAAAKEMMDEFVFKHTVDQDEQRMKASHDDFEYVIQNFALPEMNKNPALAMQVRCSPNPAETAYKLGKLCSNYEGQMGQQAPKNNPAKAEKILKNASRPTSSAAASSPLKSQVDNFSNMSKQEIWQQSQKYARGA